MRVLLVVFVISCCWGCHARDLTVMQSNDKLSVGESQNVQEVSQNEHLCTICEEYGNLALNYLEENKTQTEIMSILHKSCSQVPSFERQCTILVDYYAPLFFSEVSKMQAGVFCRKFGLCEEGLFISQRLSKDKCDICHNVVAEALLKLKDPDTELEIVELLLKACDSAGKNAKKCKKLVFQYAPIILVNAEEFLEKNDLCTILHACDSAAASAEEALLGTETSMHAAS